MAPGTSGEAPGAEPGHPPSRTVTKPLLVAISRSVEAFALAAPDDPPLVVIGMFQRAPYFMAAAETYARIGRTAGATLVGFAGPVPPDRPDSLTYVAVSDNEYLAGEWSVTVLGAHSGATLVARDREIVDGSARSLERGRTFTARWSFRRTAAVAELERLRADLGTRLPAGGAVDRALASHASDTAGADRRHEDAMTVVVERLAGALHRSDRTLGDLDDMRPGAERDPQSGLPTRAFLDRWTAGSVGGTLPLGLVLVRVHELAHVRRRHGPETEREILVAIARVLNRRTGDADRAVRVGREEFLLVMPSRPTDQLARWAERARAEIGALSGTHPFVPTPASAVITQTRRRPLPLPELWAALDRAVDTGVPVTVLGP